MRLIHSFDNMFLFSYHNVTHMNVSKQYNENRGASALLTIRKHQINLRPSSNFPPKMVPLTGTVPLTYFMGYSESILCYLYCILLPVKLYIIEWEIGFQIKIKNKLCMIAKMFSRNLVI